MKRRHAVKLLDQQLWCWGSDVRRAEGNLLIRYGFDRQRPPENTSGSSYYRFSDFGQFSVGLWGFGVLFIDCRLGAVYLQRFGFRPTYCPYLALPDFIHRPQDVRIDDDSVVTEKRALLTARALGWIADYEAWISKALPPAYREQVIRAWGNMRKPIVSGPLGMSHAWRDLAREYHCAGYRQHADVLKGKADDRRAVSQFDQRL